MTGDPLHQVFWLASRAFGITSLILLALSVSLGLAMSSRVLPAPGMGGRLRRIHEPLALVTVAMVAIHGGLLLFDSYLRPGLIGVTVPFQLGYRPVFTGLGIVAGWSAAVLAASFYVRRRIGSATWRRLHRLTILVYLAALVHVAGAGTDATQPWMLALLSILTAPVVFGVSLRLLPSGAGSRTPLASRG